MKKGFWFPILVLVCLAGLFLLNKNESFKSASSKYFLFYQNTNGGISKIPLPASSGTGDGNIYLTGGDGRTVYGVVYGVSGEIRLLEDPIDVATDFSQVIPPDGWIMHPSGHKMMQRMYKVFSYLEKGDEGFLEASKDENADGFEIYKFFRSPENSAIKECIQNPYSDVVVDQNLNESTRAMCKEKVPNNLVFRIHDTDDRYRRFRIHLFYTAYKERDPTVCEPLLTTKFPSDKPDDVIASHINNYLLCETIAQGDPYSRVPLAMSESIRRTGFRINIALTEDKCDLYSDPRIRSLCKPFRDYYIKSIQGTESLPGR